MPAERRRNALRVHIARAGLTPPPTTQLHEISGALLSARADAQPEVRWAGAILRRRAGRLELRHCRRFRAARAGFHIQIMALEEQRRCRLKGGDLIELIDDPAGPLNLDKLPATLEIRHAPGR